MLNYPKRLIINYLSQSINCKCTSGMRRHGRRVNFAKYNLNSQVTWKSWWHWWLYTKHDWLMGRTNVVNAQWAEMSKKVQCPKKSTISSFQKCENFNFCPLKDMKIKFYWLSSCVNKIFSDFSRHTLKFLMTFKMQTLKTRKYFYSGLFGAIFVHSALSMGYFQVAISEYYSALSWKIE